GLAVGRDRGGHDALCGRWALGAGRWANYPRRPWGHHGQRYGERDSAGFAAGDRASADLAVADIEDLRCGRPRGAEREGVLVARQAATFDLALAADAACRVIG